MSYLGLRTWDPCEVVSSNFYDLQQLRLHRLTSSDWGLRTPCEPALIEATKWFSVIVVHLKTLYTNLIEHHVDVTTWYPLSYTTNKKE